MGPYWRVVFSDFTPDGGGNKERMAYLYDKRTVSGYYKQGPSGLPTAILQERFGSNLRRNRGYDQIFHYPIYNETLTNQGGILDFFHDDHQALYPGIKMNKHEFTFELSDHLPLWVQINVDSEHASLNQKLQFIG